MRSEGNCGAGVGQPAAHEPRKTRARKLIAQEIPWHNAPRLVAASPTEPPTPTEDQR